MAIPRPSSINIVPDQFDQFDQFDVLIKWLIETC
jgi:hypothetical protein